MFVCSNRLANYQQNKMVSEFFYLHFYVIIEEVNIYNNNSEAFFKSSSKASGANILVFWSAWYELPDRLNIRP